jgi:hypothetical protein
MRILSGKGNKTKKRISNQPGMREHFHAPGVKFTQPLKIIHHQIHHRRSADQRRRKVSTANVEPKA